MKNTESNGLIMRVADQHGVDGDVVLGGIREALAAGPSGFCGSFCFCEKGLYRACPDSASMRAKTLREPSATASASMAARKRTSHGAPASASNSRPYSA